MKKKRGRSERMMRSVWRFTSSALAACSVLGASEPVAGSLRRWWPMAATLNVVQSQPAQMMSGRPKSVRMHSAVSCMMSVCRLDGNRLSQSTVKHSCPRALKALLRHSVPLNSSSIFIVGWDVKSEE